MGKRKPFFRQCEMVHGTTHTVGYIPEDAAAVGRKITLEEMGGDEVVWTITQVGDHRLPEKLVKERQKTDVFGSLK